MWIVVLKLGGDSKFGSQPLQDIRDLREALMRSIALSLETTFNPILTRETSIIVLPDGELPRISALGGESLKNAVRDFAKSDVPLMQSLGMLDAAAACITTSLRWLRIATFAAGTVSGLCAVGAIAVKATNALPGKDWPFYLAFGAVVFCLLPCVYCSLRVILCANTLDKEKARHADVR